MNRRLLPGATIGMLGGGQLGRMFILAARRLGYRVRVLSPERDSPAGMVADVEHAVDYLDLDTVTDFARHVDVVTFEFENVPAATTEAVERIVPVLPGSHVLHVTQDRLREKSTLRAAGLPTARFAPVHGMDELQRAQVDIGPKGVLKTTTFGYDGKGQRLVTDPASAARGWGELEQRAAIYEEYVEFAHELSVIGGRNEAGDFRTFGPFLNEHRHHILDISVCPAEQLSPRIQADAIDLTRTVFETLRVVGVLCVEFFLTADGRLLINELAPRPHNSGHLTIDAHWTCQFEQQVRAVCGLPLGCTEPRCAAAMANLLGDLWTDGEPEWPAVLGQPHLKLHLYGKHAARPGRKMGHLTVLGDNAREARQLALRCREQLTPRPVASAAESRDGGR